MAFLEDISNQKSTEFIHEEQQVRMAHTAKMAALGEMAGGVAHEINTPLTVIGLRIEQMLDSLQSEKAENPELLARMHKGLSQVQSTVNRIANIVKGLRAFAREGRQDPLERVKVSSLLESTLDLCKERFASHGIPLSVNKNEAYFGCEVECRQIEISQVILNLLNNAFDAVQSLPTKWVRVEVLNLTESLEISITDSGPGIPKDLREKIMQPFFTTKDIGKGTGLGLSISKGIIDQHGGKLTIDDKCPHTKFTLSLPKFRKGPASGAA
jgi:C4-dicarboxylate-specific signal transduction histidine kinase